MESYKTTFWRIQVLLVVEFHEATFRHSQALLVGGGGGGGFYKATFREPPKGSDI